MRLATFNLESLDSLPKAGVSLEERANILRPQLERMAADIVCFQEVNAQRAPGSSQRQLLALDALLTGTRYEHFNRVSTLAPGKTEPADVHNLVILSRFDILNHRQVRHDYIPPLGYEPVTAKNGSPANTNPEPNLVTWHRPILMADLMLSSGQALTVLNVHLRAPLAAPIPGQKVRPFVWRSVGGWAEGYFIASMMRTGQALELRLAVERLMDADPHRLIAICGDFNSDNHETPMRIIIGVEEDTGNGHLAERALVPLDRSLVEEKRYSVLHHGRPQMLDHILTSHALLGQFRKIECHNETLQDELVAYAKVDRPPASYHAPLVAEFSFQNP